jgi:hypothetical protein
MLGPDHLLFLLALGLVGLQKRLGWMVGLLATGLAGSSLGLVLPGLPLAEPLVALSLVVVGLVLLGRLPALLLVPAFALHGYVLSASVIGWEPNPIAFYLVGLLISQGLLLATSLTLVRRWGTGLNPAQLRLHGRDPDRRWAPASPGRPWCPDRGRDSPTGRWPAPSQLGPRRPIPPARDCGDRLFRGWQIHAVTPAAVEQRPAPGRAGE